MLDVMSGGRLVAGFPVGTPMDTTYCYGQIAGDAAREIPRGRRADPARLERARAVLVQRQVHPAALRQHLAAADPEAAAAGLDPGRRQRRDLGLVRRQRLPLRQPVLLRLQGGPEDHGRLLGGGRRSAAAERNPYRAGFLQFIAVADNDAEAERLYARAGAVFLPALPARLSGLCEPAGLHVDGDDRRPASRARCRASPTAPARAPRWRR